MILTLRPSSTRLLRGARRSRRPGRARRAIIEKLLDGQYQTTRAGRNFMSGAPLRSSAEGDALANPATFEAMVIRTAASRASRGFDPVCSTSTRPAVPPPASMAGASWLPRTASSSPEQWSDDSPDLCRSAARGVRDRGDRRPPRDAIRPAADAAGRDTPLCGSTDVAGCHAARLHRGAWEHGRDRADARRGHARAPAVAVVERRRATLGGRQLAGRTLRIAPSGESAPLSPRQRPGLRGDGAPYWLAVSALLAAGWLATALAWWWSRRARGRRRGRRGAEAEG